MPSVTRLAAILVTSAALLSCAGAQRPNAASAFTASLDTYFRQEFPADEPGAALLVLKDDRIVFSRGYGLADLANREPVTPRTLFNLGSISKTFVANAILVLAHEGKLSLDDNLQQYFPEFRNPQIARRVQLRHLLTHTSGLPDNRRVAENVAFYLTAKDRENWQPITQAEALDFEPGTRFAYSNPAFNGLALIIEQASGMKWQAYVRERIFLPSGMMTSTITDGPHPESRVAHGYAKEADGRWVEADYGEVPTFAAAGNGGVWSSVEELALYEKALRGGAFLPIAIVADSRTVRTFDAWAEATPPEVGWSWFISATPDGLRRVGHTGSQGGFRASYVTLPEKHLFFVVLSNGDHDLKPVVAHVMDALTVAHWLGE